MRQRLKLFVQWENALDFRQHTGQGWRFRSLHIRFLLNMLVMRKTGDFRMVWRIIVTKDQLSIAILVVIAVHQANNNILYINQFTKMQP